MTEDFATAMRRALEKTRAADPAGAAALIREAMGGGAALPQEDDRSAASSGAGLAGMLRGLGQGARGGIATGAAGLSGGLGGFERFLPGGEGLAGMTGGLSGLAGGPGTAPEVELPPGARVERRRFACAAGARDYRLFVPSERPGGPVGVVLMLHGCTQNADDFARGTAMDRHAEEMGLVVAYPQQGRGDNPNGCWNWFRPGDQAREGGEPAILAGLAADLCTRFDLPAGRAAVAGLSAGGAMAAILAVTHADVFAAAGVHSGLPAGAASDTVSAFAAMRGEGQGQARPAKVPLIVFHGSADHTVAPVNGARLVPGDGIETDHQGNGRQWSRLVTPDGSELWTIRGAGHAWAGGNPAGSYADALGADASAEMARFFRAQMTGDDR